MEKMHVITVNDHLYGIRATDISAITRIDHVTTLPVPLNQIRQIAVINNVTTYLYNLTDYLDETFEQKTGKFKGILLNKKENNIGFLFQGQYEIRQTNENELLELNKYFQSDIFTHYVLNDSNLIIIINIITLFKNLQNEKFNKIKPDFIVPGKISEKPVNRIKKTIFHTGQITLAVNEYLIKNENFHIDKIFFYPHLPDFINGVIIYKRDILPVINLAKRFNLSDSAEVSGVNVYSVIIIKIAGLQFALKIETDNVLQQFDVNTFFPLPLLVNSNWLERISVKEKSIVLLVDFLQFFQEKQNNKLETLQKNYVINQNFTINFTKNPLEIFEFSLRGNTFAVPAEEIADEFSILPFYPIPDTPGSVLGVCEIEREFIPVLDLLSCFGVESGYDKNGAMLLLKHKHFKTILIVEKVYGKKTLPPDVQRKLPLVLPHPIIFGCYLDDNIVKLILNIEAIAIYFEKIETMKVLESLAKDFTLKLPKQTKANKKNTGVKNNNNKNVEKKPALSENRDQKINPGQKTISNGKILKSTKNITKQNKITRVKNDLEIHEKQKAVVKNKTEIQNKKNTLNKKKKILSKNNKIKESNDEPVSVYNLMPKKLTSVRTSEFGFQNNQLTKIPADDKKYNNEITISSADTDDSSKSKKTVKPVNKWLLISSAVFICCLLTVSLYWLFDYFKHKTFDDKSKITTGKQDYANLQQVKKKLKPLENNDSNIKTSSNMNNAVHNLSGTDNTEVLEYEVQTGDTLARISNKYTGDYYNYPDIARENAIDNPHLIFPRQKILIKVDKY